MRLFFHLLTLLGILVISLEVTSAETHGVVVVSSATLRGQSCEIRLLDVESGGVKARVQVGDMAEAALSPGSELIAICSRYSVAGVAQPHTRLEVFRASDLSPVKSGWLPVRRGAFGQLPKSLRMQFSPDAKELVVQRMESFLSDDKPIRRTVDEVVLTRIQLELDDAGMFKIAGQPFKIPRARSVQFLRSTEWPRITVWNHFLGAIEVLDLSADSVLTHVPLGDDKVLANADARYLEKPNIGSLVHRLGFWANMVTSDGKHAYYVSEHVHQPNRHPLGFLRKIDLTTDPARVVLQFDERQSNLKARVAAVSETAGALFVAEDRRDPSKGLVLPSSLVKTFHTSTLKPASDIQLSLTDCYCLAASRDGKYLYALDFAGGMAVVDISTGKEVKVLPNVGVHPGLVLALD